MLFLSFCGGLSAQQLFISKMDTWFRNGGNGYCSDVDSSITVAASNPSAISGTLTGVDDGWNMTGTITGTRYFDSLGVDGNCTSAGTPISATGISGTFSAPTGSVTGTLSGFEGYANGVVTGTATGEPTGTVAAVGTMHCVPTSNGPTSEGFETGNLTGAGIHWATQGNAAWSVWVTTRDTGSYAVGSNDIGNGQYTALTVGLHVTVAGPVNFRYKVDSEGTFDYLRYYVDGAQIAAWSGQVGWATSLNYNLPVGFHVLRWVYTKDGSVSTGSDAAWLDNITFPTHTQLYNGVSVPSGASINTTVYGTDNGAGLIAGAVSHETITGPLTCTAGPPVCTPGSFRWVSLNPADDRARGTVTGTVSGPPVWTDTKVSFYTSLTGQAWNDSSQIQFERPKSSYPGGCLGLCASIMCVVGSTPAVFGIDDLTFDIFKFGHGSNPLDPASTPPIKTISIFNVGTCDSADSYPPNQFGSNIPIGTFCTAWDGSYNLNGSFGKTNGQFGYRAKVTTRQTTAQGSSIDIEQTAAYPGVNQIPIQVDVTNIHMPQSNPTGVGNVTRVPAQPYNLKYRLSKDATATITIWDTDVSHQTGAAMTLVRTIISSQPRVGEGVPDGVLTNGDWWDGRNNSGAMVPAGSYLARIAAGSNDDWSAPPYNRGEDLAWPATIQMTLDPLQVTDVGMRPLGVSATDMAVISYMLTEAATAYVDIYTPGTRFVNTDVSPPVLIGGTGTLLKRFMEEEGGRQTTSVYWDGRDASGSPVCDGDYIYAIYAEMPSTGQIGNFTWNSVKTRRTTVGTIPVARGPVLAFMSPSSTVMGSSPTAAGLDPFFFRYTPARNTTVNLNIKSMDGGAGAIIKNLVSGEVRFANVLNRESWDGKRNDGSYVSSGTYLAELVTTDPYLCAAQATSTMTVQFPVHMFRILDVRGSSLLGGASAYATVSFELSQTMQVELNIYEADQVVNPSLWPWPAGTFTDPLFTAQGLRPGRMRITEPWDGRNKNGLLVPDGHYPFTLVAYTTGTAEVVYATDRVYGYVDVSRGQILFSMFEVYPTIPTMYNSSDTIKLPPYTVEYAVTRQSSVTVQVVTLDMPPYVVAEVVTGEVRDGDTLYKDFWDGKCTATAYCGHTDYVTGGDYNVRVMAQDLGMELKPRATVQQTIDVYPIRIFDLSITPLTIDSPAVVSYQLSEPMKMVTKIYKPGTNLPGLGDPTNALVKRIIGVRPARTQISEYWDGTDLTLSKVSDGNYVFRLYGTTVTSNIDTLTGNALNPGLLADDIIVSNIPVVKSGTADLCGDFARETFFAPNPYMGTSGWFKIPAIMNGRIGLHIYNLAGDMVYTKDFGERGGGNNVDGNGQCVNSHTNAACWPKVNASGRTVAPGVYLAVIRFEATEGTRDVCQVVKKILIP